MAVWRQKQTTWLDRLFNVEVIPVTHDRRPATLASARHPLGPGLPPSLHRVRRCGWTARLTTSE